MTLINPFNVNAQGIGAAAGFGAKTKAGEEAQEKEAEVVSPEQKHVSADEVLNYLAQSAVSAKAATAKTVDPSKYVDEASAARIAGFVQDFEGKVTSGIAAFDEEFPEAEVSDSAKMAVVLKQINQEA